MNKYVGKLVQIGVTSLLFVVFFIILDKIDGVYTQIGDYILRGIIFGIVYTIIMFAMGRLRKDNTITKEDIEEYEKNKNKE